MFNLKRHGGSSSAWMASDFMKYFAKVNGNLSSVADLAIFAGNAASDGVDLLGVEILAEDGRNVGEVLRRKWAELQAFGATFVPVSIEAVFTAICAQNGAFCSGGLLVNAGEEVTEYDGSRRAWTESVRCFYR